MFLGRTRGSLAMFLGVVAPYTDDVDVKLWGKAIVNRRALIEVIWYVRAKYVTSLSTWIHKAEDSLHRFPCHQDAWQSSPVSVEKN
ncbi:hypothetical protein BS50DRAFT_341456 [Corynespora cassiicola Philippines]|uniref:Uncharacterized protein n=1 Tax=Corynespora cassiicola Philippines TaxID=1448308 RepID=A0A2T2NVH8_CORCC|nr:hypothetical protein BS50DRAFT_341456 [Corynespora cassiicola Philippines]